ncbi:adenylyltransferase/cytidyltransferase family protein [Stenotrophomonas maltophilia]|uniref:adenylyltransferase/cytidyltransferase family protein n=1 Tax=Stenotrophomonas maltophilia TaxID=40324 RepID=UPI000C259676|nr:adenylyltransferase/cytidyltransferase family protein [Stenotrophomonas maltophilia]PJL44900.1 glycerol-3-phosphate cytidiltransferase [Stenotrophomonas maltophilia]
MNPRTVLTYGTFDLFHVGHLNLLRRMRALGDRLIVGVSTDEFNERKGKKTVVPFKDRLAIVESIKYVDAAIAESDWDQKLSDIEKYAVSVFGMGDDWEGKFDHLAPSCEVVYLPRTSDISSTEFKRLLSILDAEHVTDLKKALDLISTIVDRFE